MNTNTQSVLDTTRTEWLQERRRGIGGSDVAAILGLSPWKTPLDVYLDKVGQSAASDTDSPAMYWGRTLEPVIRQHYADTTGRNVIQPPNILTHPEHAFMLANVDGLTEDGRVFEAKTARTAQGWGEPGSGEVPDAYALQVQHYMAVTGLPVADVAVLIGGSDFRLYHVEADPGLQADLILEEANFWQRVVKQRPPEPVTFAEVAQRWGKSDRVGNVIADPDVCVAWSELVKLRASIKDIEAREEELKAMICKALGDRGDTLITPTGNVLATWKQGKPVTRLNVKRLTEDHPDLVAQYREASEASRRLLIKEA